MDEQVGQMDKFWKDRRKERNVLSPHRPTPRPPQLTAIGASRGELRVISTQGPQGRYLMKQNLRQGYS